jgi:hypothetical protein
MTGATMMGEGRRNGLRPYIWGTAACLLLLPAIAMLAFPGSGVDWSGFDFLAMGVMLAALCGLYEFGAWLSGNTAYRAAFGIAALAGFLTVWVNLAVGMLGSEDDSVNVLFACVLLVATVGALAARLKAAGMAWAMAATAGAQLLAVGIGWAMGGFHARELVLTAAFAVPWSVSAALFREAARAMRA